MAGRCWRTMRTGRVLAQTHNDRSTKERPIMHGGVQPQRTWRYCWRLPLWGALLQTRARSKGGGSRCGVRSHVAPRVSRPVRSGSSSVAGVTGAVNLCRMHIGVQ